MTRVVETVTAKIEATLKIKPIELNGSVPVNVNITPDVKINYKNPVFTEGRPLKIVIPVGGGEVEQCINKCWTGPLTAGDKVVRVRWTNHLVSDGSRISGMFCVSGAVARSPVLDKGWFPYLKAQP